MVNAAPGNSRHRQRWSWAVVLGTCLGLLQPAQAQTTSTPVLTGTVFEDVNYGGGAGRPRTVTGSAVVPNATVELYTSAGAFISSSTTDATGKYSFNTVNGSYIVRVVNSTITSSRTGYVASLIPVQTYNGTTTAVGGQQPALTDAPANNGSQSLAALTTASAAPESIASVTTSGLATAGPDFGFNYDLVVNTKDAGQGSLRQFIANASALGNEASLVQSGSNTAGALPAQRETSIFMISDGLAHPGLTAYNAASNPGLISQLSASGVAVITPATVLPAIAGANANSTSIDGTTQTQNVGNTNAAVLGAGGTVGVGGASTLSKVNGPEVQVVGTSAIAVGLDIATGVTNASISGLAVYGFGTAGDNDTSADIRTAGTNTNISQNVLGTSATSFTDLGAARSLGDHIRATGGSNGTSIFNNLIGFGSGKGATTRRTTTGLTFTNNEVRGNGIGNSAWDGLDAQSGNIMISGNLFIANRGIGADCFNGIGNVTIDSNTISDNGKGIDGTAGANLTVETAGVRLFGPTNTVSKNVITGNYGSGISATGGAPNTAGGIASRTTSLSVFTQNSIYDNGTVLSATGFAASGGIGIDLLTATDPIISGTFPYVTLNDNGDVDTGANDLLNYPVIASATITGANITIKGYARAGSKIELFSAGSTPDASGFGEGQTYLGTVTEGGAAGGGNLAADTDARTGLSYSGFINGTDQGSDNSANGFTFVIPLSSLPGGTLAARTVLSSTATLAGATSEFSGNIPLRDITVANDDVVTTPVNTAITFAVTGNDTPNADLNTATIDLDPNTAGIQTSFTVAGEGVYTTVGVAAGSVKFTPDAGFVGIANTPYTVQNTSGATSNQANLVVKVESQLDLATTISAPATVVAGAQITVSGTTVNNSLAGTTANVVQKVQLPVGLTGTIIVNGTSQTITAATTATGLFTFGTLNNFAAGSTSSFSLQFTAPVSGPFTVTALVSPTATDINQANNSASAVVAVTTQTDIATTITGPATNPRAGNLLTYAVTTANNSTLSPALGVVQTVQLPTTGITGVYASNGGVYNASTGIVTFPAVNLAPGQVVNNVVGFVAPAAGTVLNAVQAFVPTAGDPVTANNTSTATSVTTQAATVASANLYVKVAGPATNGVPAQVAVGSTVTYTVEQGNNGPSPASNVQTVVSLPPNLSSTTLTLNGSMGTLSGSVITFGSGATASTYNLTTGVLILAAIGTQANAVTPVTYTIGFPAPAASLAISVSAGVSSDTSDPVAANNQATAANEISPSTDVAISLTNPAGAGNVAAGQTVVYSVATQNNSDYTARGVVQTVAIPAGQSVATLLFNGVAGTAGTGVITFAGGAIYNVASGLLTLPTLASLVKGTVVNNTISFVPAGNTSGIRGLATVTSQTPDAVASNNTASLSNGVNLVADLTVNIAGPAQALSGSPVLYTVTTTNNGPSASNNAGTTQTTSVQLPTGLTGVEVRDNAGAIVTGAYSAATGVVTFASTTLVPGVGQSVQGTILFIAPDATQVSLAATVALTAPSATNYDANADNNSARISTPLLAPSLASADLQTTFTAVPAAALNPGATATYTIQTTNNTTGVAAQNPVQLVSLPVGLSAATLTLNGATGTLTNGVISFGNNSTYTVATGQLNVPSTTALISTGNLTNTVAFPMPLTNITVTATSASDNPDAVAANNTVRSSTTANQTADVALAMTGPASTTAGSSVSYTVSAVNNGPSPATGVTVLFTLPAGVTTYSVNGGAPATVAAGSQVTLPTSSQTLVPGGSLTYLITLTAPTAASFTASAGVTTTSAGNVTTNDNGSVRTTENLAPVASDIVNVLQSPQGNTSVTLLALSPLSATDPEGTTLTYNVTSLPPTAQGVLYYNGVAVTPSTLLTTTTGLTFDPAAGYVGSVFFNYTATDTGNGTAGDALTSVPALYTIQVGSDNSSVYTAVASKGGANKYATNDVLATVIDPNGAVYNSATPSGLVYNASGVQQAGTANGLPTTGTTNAVLAASGPASNPTNVLPAGTALDPTTGKIYVSNAGQLASNKTSATYSVNVITTDVNGGTNVVPATFTIGALPLPVELTAFTATAVKNIDAALLWHTAQEQHNDRFEVERSLNGTDFVKISEVKGQGNKPTATDYALTDASIGLKVSGLVYYRLRQVDADGTASYSPVRPVSFTPALTPAISLFPNPATTGTQLDLTALPTGRYQVSVLDAAGRVVLNTALEAGLVHALQLNTIASGSYILLVRGTNGGRAVNLTKRLIKE